MVAKPCNYCRNLVPYGTKCPCVKPQKAARLGARERGYTHEWDKARLLYLQRNPLCVRCAPERVSAATDVDHILPHRGDKRLFWDVNNWQSLCKSCHSRKTAMEDGSLGNGQLLPDLVKPKRCQITVICGPYVEDCIQGVEPAYQMIEVNRLICGALYESTAKQRRLAVVDRNALLRQADTWRHLYMVVGGASRHERAHWGQIATVRVVAEGLDTVLGKISRDCYGGKDWRSEYAITWWNHYVS